MKYQEVKSWVENEGIVSTVQCNRVISHGQDHPPPPIRRSLSEHDLAHFEMPPPPPPIPTQKVHVELSPYLDIDYGEKKRQGPKVELVPNHIFQYYVKHLYSDGGPRDQERYVRAARAKSPPPRRAQVEVKKFEALPPKEMTTIHRSESGSRRSQSDVGVRWAPGTQDTGHSRTYYKEKEERPQVHYVDPNVPRHWWQYNHPGKLADHTPNVFPASAYSGYDSQAQNVIEKRYVVDQVENGSTVEQNPVYSQVQRRGVLRNSSQRSSYTTPPEWAADGGSGAYGSGAYGSGAYGGPDEITVNGRNTQLFG